MNMNTLQKYPDKYAFELNKMDPNTDRDTEKAMVS